MLVYSPSSVTLQHKMSANLVQIGSHLYNEGSNTNLFFHLSEGGLRYDKYPIMCKICGFKACSHVHILLGHAEDILIVFLYLLTLESYCRS